MEAPSRSILIVEDHSPTSAVFARMVRARGFRVVAASSLAEAREAAAQHDIGFLISDLGLADGDGCELMQELRARYGIRGAVISGYGSAADLARSAEAGFIVHLVKPITAAELEDVLKIARRELERRPPHPGGG
ncbi:MAG TPA: response regulator [Rariglobus sp.]|nr:response regulator [Rariglobus sp.]HTL69543.1 response regulator [Lacunisphaera sp.]